MEQTFTEERRSDIAETAYISGNPQTHPVFREWETGVNPNDFDIFEEVWKYAWNETLGTIEPDPITDRAIDVYRSNDVQRMIVHYMQPHFPAPTRPDLGSEIVLGEFGTEWESIWKDLKKRNVTKAEVWDAYEENLEYVLGSVEKLLSNIDAERVAITADHGNAVGEYGYYGHGMNNLQCVREVPWCRTTARNTENYEPNPPSRSEEQTLSVEKRLQALGYKQ